MTARSPRLAMERRRTIVASPTIVMMDEPNSKATPHKPLLLHLLLLLVVVTESTRPEDLPGDHSLASCKSLLLRARAEGFPFSITNTTRWEAMVRASGVAWADENRPFVVGARRGPMLHVPADIESVFCISPQSTLLQNPEFLNPPSLWPGSGSG